MKITGLVIYNLNLGIAALCFFTILNGSYKTVILKEYISK